MHFKLNAEFARRNPSRRRGRPRDARHRLPSLGTADDLPRSGCRADYYDRRHAERVRRRAIATLERQGYRVMLEPAA